MFGIEIYEILSIGRQLGLALAGAAAFWGMIFMVKGNNSDQVISRIIYEWIAERLMVVFGGAFMLAISCWLGILALLPASAHEGIVLVAEKSEIISALELTFPLYVVWICITAIGILWRLFSISSFHQYAEVFYTMQFMIIFAIISFPAWMGMFGSAQYFFMGHSFHSIFTVGTVLVLDFLFLNARKSVVLQQHLVPMFPVISKVIWIGLGLDFLSVALVFDEAVRLIPKYYFMQTIVGILIINGVMLSGPITRKLMRSLEKGGEELSARWMMWANIAGVISAASWMTITVVDYIEGLTLSYPVMLLGYGTLIGVMYVGHEIFDRFDSAEPVGIH